MSQIEKIAWQWNTINNEIENFKQTISPNQICTILSQDLFVNPEVTIEIFDFMEVANPYFETKESRRLKKILKYPINVQKKGTYPKYDDWRDNFLRPTLETCYEYLREDRYLLWNIADIKIGTNKYYTLEQDSIDIIKSLGGEYIGKLKMLMTSMIGVDQSNVKNSVKVNGTYLKYEPIFVFKK